jgi:hypothetical protein
LQEVVLANFTTTSGIGTKLYIHFVFALSNKYTSTQDKDMASTSRNLRGLSRHDIDIILGSDLDEYDIDLDETDEEEDDLTGQPLNPPVRVTKQGGWTNRGEHDLATNDSSDDDDITPVSPASEDTSKWGQPTDWRNRSVHQFTGDTPGKRQNVAPHINKNSTPFSVFMLYFAHVITLLVEETNRYYHQYLLTLERDSLADYWSMTEQFHTPFHSKTPKRDRFFHIIRFLHFSNNDTGIDKNDPHYDRLSKVRTVFDMLNDAYSKYYDPSEHLAVDEVIVLFKGRVIFRQYLPKKYKRFGIKIYKLCDKTGYTYDMVVYLGKDRTRVTADMTLTHTVVKRLTRKVQG